MIKLNKIVNESSQYFYFVSIATASYFTVQKAKKTGVAVKNYDFVTGTL
jgi:hypothetical protein